MQTRKEALSYHRVLTKKVVLKKLGKSKKKDDLDFLLKGTNEMLTALSSPVSLFLSFAHTGHIYGMYMYT